MFQASRPLVSELELTTAAVCVYPNRVKDAFSVIERMGFTKKIQIASGKHYISLILLTYICLVYVTYRIKSYQIKFT